MVVICKCLSSKGIRTSYGLWKLLVTTRDTLTTNKLGVPSSNVPSCKQNVQKRQRGANRAAKNPLQTWEESSEDYRDEISSESEDLASSESESGVSLKIS